MSQIESPDCVRESNNVGPEFAAPPQSSSSAPKGSPEWWRDRLVAKLLNRNWRIRRFDNYYEGVHKLAFATEQFRRAFGGLFAAFSDNFMQIVVDSVDERLAVEGFRIPGAGTNPEALLRGDDQAWAIWQANQMDSGSQLVHTDALVHGMSYVIVGPGDGVPRVSGESAFETIVERSAGSKRRIAALKLWKDDEGIAFATLYLPTRVFKWVTAKPQDVLGEGIQWSKRPVQGEAWPLVNPTGVVPVIEFQNRPRLVGEPRSEIEQLIPLQDAINKLFMDMMVASEYAGFPQRVATGIEIPVNPETNEPIMDVLKMSMDRFLHTENADAAFSTLQAADLGNYTNAIAMEIQHLASRSSTPPHYFLANMGNFPSGEALKAAETGLVSKVRRRMRGFGESWEEVIQLALLTAGDQRKSEDAVSGEVIWRDPESRSESEHIDAISKMAALGVPLEVLWEKSGMFSDTEIGRMKELVKAGAPVAKVPEPTTNGAPPAPADAATA